MTARPNVTFALVAAAVAAPAGFAAGPEPTNPPPVVVEVSDRGFHWLDAAIGAAVVLALALLVIGLTLSVRQTTGRRMEP